MPSENGHRASKAPPATGAFCHTQARPILIGCAARRGWAHGVDSQWERSPSPEVSQVEGGGSCLALLAEVSVQLSLGCALFLAYFLFYTPVLAHLHTSWPYCGPGSPCFAGTSATTAVHSEQVQPPLLSPQHITRAGLCFFTASKGITCAFPLFSTPFITAPTTVVSGVLLPADFSTRGAQLLQHSMSFQPLFSRNKQTNKPLKPNQKQH